VKIYYVKLKPLQAEGTVRINIIKAQIAHIFMPEPYPLTSDGKEEYRDFRWTGT
jgi:hypothetical protein